MTEADSEPKILSNALTQWVDLSITQWKNQSYHRDRSTEDYDTLFSVLLIALFDPVDSKIRNILNGDNYLVEGADVKANGSLMTTEDIMTVLSGMERGTDPLHLQVLYDSEYEEPTRHMSEQLSSQFSGLMVFYYDGSPMTLAKIFESGKAVKTHLLLLCSEFSIVEIFEQIRIKRLQSHFVQWILFAPEGLTKNAMTGAIEQFVYEGTHVTLVAKQRDDVFVIYTVNANNKGVMRFFNNGKWSRSDANNKDTLPLLMSPRDHQLYWDMKGRVLTVAAVDVIPYFRIGGKYPDGSLIPTVGTDVAIVRALSQALNFTFRVVSPLDNAWGYPQPDGTVTGMIGMVARREVHFAVSGIAVNGRRKTVIDYAYPYYHAYLGIYSPAPKQKNRAMAVLSPFSLQVWICIAAIILVMGPLMKIISMVSRTFQKEERSLYLHVYSFNMFRNIVTQCNPISTRQWPQRILLIFWFFFCLITSALYSGTLTAVLAIPAYERPIDYLSDLPRAVDEGYTLTVTGDSTNEYIFREAKDGIYKVVWDLFDHKNRKRSFVDRPDTALERMLHEKVVHFCPVVGGRILTASLGSKKFYEGKEKFFPQGYGVPIPQGAPYNEQFSYWLRKMNEGGLIDKWVNIENERVAVNTLLNEQSTKMVITLTHLQAAFFVIIFGYSTGAVVMLIEIRFSKLSF
ncbi:probable glutamate receptor [Palaemon carinicauda]|uniref:probable glutamate receptor n=1 Tax=Palaemon carinicauda TaxID=392227 RepID=UPI0035B599AA